MQVYCTVVALTNAVFTCSAYCLAEGLRGSGAFENSANGAARGVGEQLQIWYAPRLTPPAAPSTNCSLCGISNVLVYSIFQFFFFKCCLPIWLEALAATISKTTERQLLAPKYWIEHQHQHQNPNSERTKRAEQRLQAERLWRCCSHLWLSCDYFGDRQQVGHLARRESTQPEAEAATVEEAAADVDAD